MSKKGKEVAEEKILLGRPGNSLKMGIIGLSNIGKSLLFNVMTNSNVSTSNVMFSTVKPNEARVPVPDPRYDWLCEHCKPEKRVPAWLNVHDVSGLGGESRESLSHISACDGLYHMIRVFKDDDVPHPDETIDPIRDLEKATEELVMKDLTHCENEKERMAKVRGCSPLELKKKKEDLEVLETVIGCLKEGTPVRFHPWKLSEIPFINSLFLLTAKSTVYLINLSKKDYIRKKNKWLMKIKQWVDEKSPGEPMIPICASVEEELFHLGKNDPVELEKFVKETGAASAIPKIIKAGYDALNLMNFFTIGEDEVRSWIIRKNSKAPKAAGVIHSDIERGFICAEVQKYDDLVECGSEAAVKEAGKLRKEGKNYEIIDGDILHFQFNVTAPSKKKGKK